MSFYNFKLYNIVSNKHFEDFKKQPYNYIDKDLIKLFQKLPNIISYDQLLIKGIKTCQEGYDLVELSKNNLKKGRKNYLLEYKKKIYQFKNIDNFKAFLRNPEIFSDIKLPAKYLDDKPESSNTTLKKNIKDSSSSYLENTLAQIVMKVLANLGFLSHSFLKNCCFK